MDTFLPATVLRDIRPDLRDRLNLLETDVSQARAEFDRQLAELQTNFQKVIKENTNQIEALKALIDAEDRRMGGGLPTVHQEAKPLPATPLGEFLLERIKERERTKEELKQIAIEAGYFSDPEKAGRSIHATVVNLLRGKSIIDTDGKYGFNIFG